MINSSIKPGKLFAFLFLFTIFAMGQVSAAEKNRFAIEHEKASKEAGVIKASGIQHRMEFSNTVADGKATDKLIKRRYERFNKEGMPDQEVNFDENGKLMSKWTYEYCNAPRLQDIFSKNLRWFLS